MKPNTATTFAELRVGDRFYFAADKQKKVYQLTREALLGKPFYNHFDGNGNKVWMFDRQSDKNKPVVFLRHTQPVLGEEWPISELKDGDIFHLPDNIVTEYLVIKNRHGVVITQVNAPAENLSFEEATKVIFVRKNRELKLA